MTKAVSEVMRVLGKHDDPTRVWLIGAPWFEPPKGLLESLRIVSNDRAFPYPPLAGETKFREAVARAHVSRDQPLDADQVVVTHGAKGGLYATMKCLLAPGDQVLHPTPCYPAYQTIVRDCGASPVAIGQPGDHFRWTRAAIEEHINDRTRALILSSPANPGGATLIAEQARLLVDICREHHLRLICDEAYDDFGPLEADSSCLPASWDSSLKTVIQVRSFSKSHAVCGWRLGYVAMDQGLADRVAAWQGDHLNPPNSLAQRALAEAVTVPEDYSRKTKLDVRRRLKELADALSGAGIPVKVPMGGFYLWVDARPTIEMMGLQGSLEFCLKLAENHGVGVWPGEDFFGPGFFRLSAVSVAEEDWQSELTRLVSAIEKLIGRD